MDASQRGRLMHKLAIERDRVYLATSHVCGSLRIWHLPGLALAVLTKTAPGPGSCGSRADTRTSLFDARNTWSFAFVWPTEPGEAPRKAPMKYRQQFSRETCEAEIRGKRSV
ncbi:hypothetical protein Bbelb_231300 [Branchiostoma belcheri]|nr:hypothetical protein Bbelb_231300 [Branchiostoma belcheri]